MKRTTKFELTDTGTGATKHLTGKLMVDLVPPESTVDIAAVLTYGSVVKGYGERNWEKGIPYMTLLSAAKRHLLQFELGVDNDHESNLPHLSHALANIAMLSALTHRGRVELDNRVSSQHNSQFTTMLNSIHDAIKGTTNG